MSDASGADPTSPFSLEQRASGVLLHITSLPGPHGNGDLGAGARAFVDFLSRARQRWWQVLPINPVGFGYSPYSGVSAFAGNPLLISLDELATLGLLDRADVETHIPAERADYPASIALRAPALRKAFARFRDRADLFRDELEAFRSRAQFWLSDYTLFMTLSERHGSHFPGWEPALCRHEPAAVAQARRDLADEVAFFEFEQLMFDRQWRALRAYARERGVGLIGDVPIFVAHESADVWGNQASFMLDAQGLPSHVSGVPPDYFSETGQRWGTPLYRWDALEREGFRFWLERLRTLLEAFDVVRLDHFIGFEQYWEIPASEETAVNGRWVKAPGTALFAAAERAFSRLPLIAEDLGAATPEVTALRDRFALPGMRVLQFAFDGDARNEFLPHRHLRDCVVYTGTHDNDTTVGWYCDPGGPGGRSPERTERERKAAIRYLGGPWATELRGPIHWELIRLAFGSVANTVLIPMQDLLGLGSDQRMNTPGKAEGNWEFRVQPSALSAALAEQLSLLSETYGRAAPASTP